MSTQARWCDSATGTWICRDPSGFEMGDANLMRFCGNSDTNCVDPSGMQETPVQVEERILREKIDELPWTREREALRRIIQIDRVRAEFLRKYYALQQSWFDKSKELERLEKYIDEANDLRASEYAKLMSDKAIYLASHHEEVVAEAKRRAWTLTITDGPNGLRDYHPFVPPLPERVPPRRPDW